MKVVLEFCLASMLHHYDFIVHKTPPTSALLLSPLFQDESLRESLGQRLSTSSSDLRVTGIPPSYTLLQAIRHVPDEYAIISGLLSHEYLCALIGPNCN